MIEYNNENLKVVSELIRKNLTPDLIAKKWRERNSRNPTFGHCHTAAGCLYKIFGPKAMHCLLYTSPSPRDRTRSRMPSSA